MWSDLFIGSVNIILLKVLSSNEVLFSNKSINQCYLLFIVIVLFCYFVWFNELWDNFSLENILFNSQELRDTP